MQRTLVLATTLALAACKSGGAAPPAASDSAPAAAPLTITLAAKSGSSLVGTARFTDTGSGVRVELEVSGIAPGKHGAHIHEKPDCSAEDGSSAGGHYNPAQKDHALPPGAGHLGDLGNIEIGADGKGSLDFLAVGANLKAGDASSFKGRSIIVHANADDGGQPTGNAGGRVGCGVIE